MARKRKIVTNNENDPKQRLTNLMASIVDDDGRMDALIRFCEQSIANNATPSWANEASSEELQLLSAIGKIDDLREEKDLGELVVSSAIHNFLD